MNRSVIFFLFIFCAIASFAQDSASVANDVTILYRKEWSLGGTIHGNGLGAIFRMGKHITARKKRMFEAEFVSMRHPKQYKVTNQYTNGDAKPFFFGKLNYVYIPRVGIGQQNVIFGKAERSGVEVRCNYFGGVDLALTKPVYNEVLIQVPNENYSTPVSEQYDPNDPNQQDPSQFYGPGSYFDGLNQIKFYPGVYGKFSFSFEHSTAHQKLAIIETGMVLDLFLKTIPIMALPPNKPQVDNMPYYFNFYISLLWGAKSND
jgi:hypothetical protein